MGEDAVGDEVRGVLGIHDALAEDVFAERRHALDDLGQRVRAGDDFEEFQVTRRVEEMRADEMLAHVLVHGFEHRADQDAARVRADDGSLRAVLRDLLEDRLLDGQVFFDHLADPVAVGDLGEVVVEVADLDHIDQGFAIDRGRFGFEQGGFAGGRKAVTLVLALFVLVGQIRGYDVDHDRRDAAIGQMRRDSPSHHPRSQYCNPLDFPHGFYSPSTP